MDWIYAMYTSYLEGRQTQPEFKVSIQLKGDVHVFVGIGRI